MNAQGKGSLNIGDNIDTDVIIPARYLNTTSDMRSLRPTAWRILTQDFVKQG